MTADELLRRAALRLRPVAGELARREARLLLAGALGRPAESLLTEPDATVEAAAVAVFDAMVERRLRHEPVSRILGWREFWSLRFEITPDVLDPRPDSETLIEAALRHLDPEARAPRILDLGTGSGCLLLALLSELGQAVGVGVDISAPALDVARRNADRLGLGARARFLVGDWCEGLAGPFDLVIANPPYIREDEHTRLMPDVALYDPPGALFAGTAGLDAYRRIAAGLPAVVAGGALVVLEIGVGMGAAVTAIMAAQGFEPLGGRADLAGIERALTFRVR